MQKFTIAGSHVVPSVDFDADNGLLKITGLLVSVSSQEYQFFVPIIDWLEDYSLKPAAKTRMIVDMEFCSSAGTKNLFQVFKILQDLNKKGHDVLITWKYHADDEDSRDKGIDIKKLLDLPFEVTVHS